MADLSKLSTEDLQFVASGNMSKVSTQGLRHLAGETDIPEAPKSEGMFSQFGQRLKDNVSGALEDTGKGMSTMLGAIPGMGGMLAGQIPHQELSGAVQAGADILGSIPGMIAGPATGIATAVRHGDPQGGHDIMNQVMGESTPSAILGTNPQGKSIAYDALMKPFEHLTNALDLPGQGLGNITKALGGSDEQAANAHAATSLATFGILGKGAFGGKTPVKPKVEAYATLREMYPELKKKTDSEIVDWLEKHREESKNIAAGEKGTQGELFEKAPPEIPDLSIEDQRRQNAQGELESMKESQEFANRELTGTQDIFGQKTGFEKPDTGLEPKKQPTGEVLQPEGITDPTKIEGGFESTRLKSEEGKPLEIANPEHTPETIPYSNTVHDYIYSRFPELTEKLQRDPIVQRLMKQVEDTIAHLKELKSNAADTLTQGVGIKLEDIRTTKKAQVEMDRLKGEFDRARTMLENQTETLSNRLKSRAKEIGSSIADNSKFSDYVNDRINSSGPTDGNLYTKGAYKEGSASANIQKTERPQLGKQGRLKPQEMKIIVKDAGASVNWYQNYDSILLKHLENGNARGILQYIKNESKNVYYRQLAKLLDKMPYSPLVKEGNNNFLAQNAKGEWVWNAKNENPLAPETLGAYEPSVHGVVIKGRAALESVILHEFVHAATYGAIYKYQNMRFNDIMKITDLREREVAQGVHALKSLHEEMQARWNDDQFKNLTNDELAPYGLTDIFEFLSEGSTNAQFMAWLNRQELTGNSLNKAWGGLKTAGNVFWNAIKDILGFKGSITALEATLGNVSRIIENQSGKTQMTAFDSAQNHIKAQNMKQTFEQFKETLPEPYKDMAKDLWKETKDEKVQFETNPKAPFIGDYLSKIHGTLTNYIPLIKPYKEIRDSILAGEDITGTILGKFLVSGSKMYAQQTKNLAIKYASDIINASKKAQEVATYNKLFGEKGIIESFEKLSSKEQDALWSVMKKYKMREWRTEEGLREDGMNAKQIEAYMNTKKHFTDTINEINAERVAHGEEPIPSMPGYFPSRWKGNYYFEVYKPHADGGRELMRIETGNWKGIGGHGGLEATRKRFMEDHPEYEVAEIVERPRYGDQKATYSLFDNLLDTIGRDHPDREILDRIFDDYSAESADKTRNFRKHFDFNTGVEGYRGDRYEGTIHSNLKDALYSVEGYMRDAHNYIETKRAAREVNGMLFDKDFKDSQPRAHAYIRKYWDASNGVEQGFAKFFNFVPETVASSVGLSRYAPVHAVQSAKRATMIFLLGFNRPVFLLSQNIQPIQFMTPYLLRMEADLGRNGLNTEVLNSQFKGFKDVTAMLTQGKWMSDLGKDAMKYAVDNRIVDPHFLDDIQNSGTRSTNDLKKWVTGETTLRFSEKYARSVSFYQFVHFLDNVGLKGEELFKTAADATDIAMTNYQIHERALIYKHMGIVGDLASPLTTFKHNYFSQLYLYGKEALKNPSAAYAKPLMAFLVTQYFVGGYMGMPGRQEVDFIIDTARSIGLVDPRTPNLTQYLAQSSAKLEKNTKDVTRYGVFSGATGMDVSPTFAANSLIPDHGISQLFPVPTKIGEVVHDTGKVVGGELGRLGGGQGSTTVDRQKMLQTVTPPAYKALDEVARQNPKTGMVLNPKDHMTGDVRRGPYSVKDKNWLASTLGTNSIKESEEKQAAFQSKLQEDAIKHEKQRLISNAKDKFISGQDWSKEAKKYVELGGGMNEMVNEIKQNQMDSNMTRFERQKGIPKNVSQGNKYQRTESYGVEK